MDSNNETNVNTETTKTLSSYFQYWARYYGIMDGHGMTESCFIKTEEARQPTLIVTQSVLGIDNNFNDGDL